MLIQNFLVTPSQSLMIITFDEFILLDNFTLTRLNVVFPEGVTPFVFRWESIEY